MWEQKLQHSTNAWKHTSNVFGIYSLCTTSLFGIQEHCWNRKLLNCFQKVIAIICKLWMIWPGYEDLHNSFELYSRVSKSISC